VSRVEREFFEFLSFRVLVYFRILDLGLGGILGSWIGWMDGWNLGSMDLDGYLSWIFLD
jgi:hypothetical protein